jgi:SPP1 gp7 family putative phage head morphogenesis protein
MAGKPVQSRAEKGGGTMLPIELDMLAQATGQPRSQVDSWFGPGEPMDSIAPKEVQGRRFDFPFSTNYNPKPRSESNENAIDFYTLRRMADPTLGGLDMMRLAIETCKDKMAGQKWEIMGRDGKDGGDAAKRIKDLLAEPDGIRDFQTWERMILEDHYVLDHPAIYLKPTNKGIFLPTPIAGETVKPIIWVDGDVPFPPLPAYQRYLKGVAGPKYTLDEMIVRPYNPRPNRIYGMGPVEQCINIINLSLRRMLSQTEYYTDGTIPDGIIELPVGMNPDQVKDFQDNWDIVLSGQTAARRHGRFVPGGTKYQPTKTEELTGAIDEWLARIICWCFSISPQALVKQQNRATAQTAKETSQEEGLEPRKLWFKGLMDTLIRRCYNAPDLQFAWQDEEITDPLIKAQVYQIALGAGGSKPWMTPDEVRQAGYGMDPLSDEQKDELAPPPAPVPTIPTGKTNPDGTPAKPDESASQASPAKKPAPKAEEPAAKVQKKKSLTPIDRERPAVIKFRKAISGIMRKAFDAQRKKAVAIGKDTLGKVAKAAGDDPFKKISLTTAQIAALQGALEDMAQDGASEGLRQVSGLVDADALDAMLSQANKKAVAWAADHAAELVTEINDTTRTGLNALVQAALDNGQTNAELADAIGEFSGFDDARCDLIATTETAFADVQGNLAGWKESGVVEGKRWIVAQDEVCEECEALDGVTVPLGEDFPDEGGDGPPYHPRCRCDIVPETISQAEIEAGDGE